MKFSTTAALLSLAAAPLATAFSPLKISYDALLNNEDTAMKSSFFKALSETGMVSITDIPNLENKKDALSFVRDCAIESKATQEHNFPDGTRRLTLATHTVPNGVAKIKHDAPAIACDSFDKASESFRTTVAEVTQVFADRVSSYLEEENDSPLLATQNNMSFKTFADVVENGDHLEHFHSYEKFEQDSSQDENMMETIEMHADQGLFIAFTPGRLMNHQDTEDAEITSGFFIELADGSVEEVDFTAQDNLIFMLGDGVNQYINDKLTNNRLRAVPHTLHMDAHKEDCSRVWYGRMVLPPVDAIHPAHNLSFGELREQMIASSLKGEEGFDKNVGVGCSGGMVARDLSATETCDEDATYCWHRCMPHTEYEVSHDICAGRNLQLHCINPRLEISDGEMHGDFFLSCADSALQGNVTDFPTLTEFPRDEDVCTEAEFVEFATTVTGYDHMVDLSDGRAKLMWNVVGDEIKGRVAYNGLFGWLAIGFANPDGKKNGMHGSHALVAMPGGNYTGFSGLDLSMPSRVETYAIHPTMSPFRFYTLMTEEDPGAISTQSTVGEPDTDIESNDCFTAVSFQKGGIGEHTFNVTGVDDLIWGANGNNAYMQYHGRDDRGRFYINWQTGEHKRWEPPVEDLDDHDGHDHEHGDSGTESTDASPGVSARSFGLVIIMTVAAAAFQTLF